MKIKKILQFSIGPIGMGIFSLITLPILAWIFTQEDIGKFAMLQAVIGLSVMLFTFGLDQAYVREFHEVEDKPALLKSSILPGFLFLILFILFLSVSSWSISEIIFDVNSTDLNSLLYIGIIAAFFSRFLGLTLRMQERGWAFSISQISPKLLFLIIISVYAVYFSSVPFVYLALAHVVSLLLVSLIYAWNTRAQWVLAINTVVDRKAQSQMIHYAIPLMGSGIAFLGLVTIDRFFLRYMSSFDELGIYAIAVNFSGVALVLQMIFTTIWIPTIYKWSSEGVDSKRINNVVDYVSLAVVVLWSLVGIFSWLISYILPPEYGQVHLIVMTTMTYPLLLALSEATGVGIGIKRKTVYALITSLLALAVNVVGNYLLIPIYGAAGAAIASSIAFMVFFIIKTEISAKLWVDFKRMKMYLLITASLFFSILTNIQDVPTYTTSATWLLLLIIGLFSYRTQAKEAYHLLVRKIPNLQ